MGSASSINGFTPAAGWTGTIQASGTLAIDGKQVGYTFAGGAFTFATALATPPSIGAPWSLLNYQDGVAVPPPPANPIINVNQVPGSPATFTVTSQYIYYEEGVYPVTVTITPNAGYGPQLTMQAASFEVGDQPLAVSALTTPLTASAGASTTWAAVGAFTNDNLYSYASYALDGSLSLPSDYTASIYWGDGKTSSVPNGNISPAATTASPTLTSYNVAGSHTYARPGTYHVTVTVHDGPETVYIQNTVTVTSAGTLYPVATPTSPQSLIIGKSSQWVVGTFYDSNLSDLPSDFSGTIAWGDATSRLFGSSNVTMLGTFTNPAGLPPGTYHEFAVSGTHAYSSVGTYAVTVTINDVERPVGDGDQQRSRKLQHRHDARGRSDSTITGVKGQAPAPTLSCATFTDPSKAPASDFIVTAANWGDPSDPNNTSVAGLTITETGPGNYLVNGRHAYPEPGIFSYSITVENLLSANTGTITGTARIADARITAFAASVPSVTENVQFGPVELAYFTDADASAPITDYTAAVYWGNGTTSVITNSTTESTYGQIVVGGGGFEVMGVHTYNSTSLVAKTYHVTIVITDEVPQAKGGSYATVYTTIVDPPAAKASAASINDAALMSILAGPSGSNDGPAASQVLDPAAVALLHGMG